MKTVELVVIIMRSNEFEISLLSAITTVLSNYISETNPYILFSGLLDVLLEIAQSEYGFIGEVFYDEQKTPYVKAYATTDIAWNAETRALYEETKQKGMIFSNLDSLYGAVLKTGQCVIANQPYTDLRRGGLPPGHPALDSFMGMPLYGGGQLLGMVGIANRKNGYDKTFAESIAPFLVTCGNLIQACRTNLKHKQVQAELDSYKARLDLLDKRVILGGGYEFNFSPPTVLKNGCSIVLTKKELGLLSILVSNRNLPCQYNLIEQHVWKNIIVGDSSLRSLIRHLRRKLPELSIKTISGVGYMLVTPE